MGTEAPFYFLFSAENNLFLSSLHCHHDLIPQPLSTTTSHAHTHTHQTITIEDEYSRLHKAPVNIAYSSPPFVPYQSLLLCPEQPPQAGWGSSVPHTSSSRSNRKHRGGTAYWGDPRHTTGQTVWL